MDLQAVVVGRPAQAAGDGVDVRFHAPDGLGGAEAAERAAGERIRARDLAADDHVVAAVGHGAVQDAAEHDDVGDRQVGAAVEDEVAFDRGERAVFLEAGLVAHPDRMAFGGEEDVLVAFVGDLDGLAGLERRQSRVADQHGGILLLAAECAADGRLAHADFFRRQFERVVQLVHGEIGALNGAFGQDRAVLLGKDDQALVFQIELFLVAGPVFGLEDLVGRGETLGDVALDDVLVFQRIEFVRRGLEDANRLLQREQGGEFLDLDADMLGGLGGQLQRFGGDNGDRFAAVADFPADLGQQRHGPVVHVHDVFAGNVPGVGIDDLGPVEGGIRPDGLEDAARHRRTDHDALQNALVLDVVQIPGPAADLAVGIHADHRLADQVTRLGVGFPHDALLPEYIGEQ